MVSSSFPTQGQGVINTPIVTPDEIIASMQGLEKLPGGVIIGDGSRVREVRVGEILAQLTADVANVGDDNVYIPRKSTESSATAATGQADVTVDDAHMFAVGDVVTLDDGTDAMDETTIASINYVTKVITMTANFGNGTNPHPVNSRLSATASGQDNSDGIAGERYTPNVTLTGITGRTSMYIGGLFKLAKLKGSRDGLDTTARAALAAQDVASPEGTLVRVRLGDPTATS